MEENALTAFDDRAEVTRTGESPLPGLLICSYRPSDELYCLIQAFLSEPYPSILLVDDGSGPEYRSLFERIAAIDRRIQLLTLEHNQGKGAALKHGFRHALKASGDSTHLLCVDSDGQHLPKDVLAVAELCRRSQGQVVLGARQFTWRTPLRNLVGNQLIRFLLNFVCRTRLQDTQTGLRAIPVDRLRELSEIPSNRFDYEMRQLLGLIRARAPIREIPIEAVYSGDYQTHFRPFRDSLTIVRALGSSSRGLGRRFIRTRSY